jgi:hypothetical protein
VYAVDKADDDGDVYPKFVNPLLPTFGDRLFLADDETKKGGRLQQ